MRLRATGLIAILSFAIGFMGVSTARAQEGGGGGRGGAGAANPTPPGPPHDPHDLNGIWLGPVGGGGGAGANSPKTASAWAPRVALPLTPDGQKQMDTNKPSSGPRQVKPAFGNDPLGGANPPGLLRTLMYGNFGASWKIIQLEDEVMQVFEFGGFWRQIWTDGRKVPADPDVNWFGYSVGKWDSDVLDVQTAGLDNREWLDIWGTPFSDSLRVEERWHRADRDNLELTATFTDPTFYTKPWTSDKKTYRFQPKGSKDGEIYQFIFSPMDEQSFNNNVRDPVAGVNHTPSK